eukprot:1470858-Pyramimonas_sp.AAC.1
MYVRTSTTAPHPELEFPHDLLLSFRSPVTTPTITTNTTTTATTTNSTFTATDYHGSPTSHPSREAPPERRMHSKTIPFTRFRALLTPSRDPAPWNNAREAA